MSNHLAIATVTASLREIIRRALDARFGGSALTSIERPAAEGASTTEWRVNLFLYRVVPNAAQRNNDAPTRRADGTLVQRPTVALDLHYLVSFYGTDNNHEPQRALGVVVAALQTWPILARSFVQSVIDSDTHLSGGDLASAPESIRISPHALDMEETSKLWSTLFQTAYVPSVTYVASPVLVESDQVPATALPVRSSGFTVRPFPVAPRVDRLEKVLLTSTDSAYILPTSSVRVFGANLRGSLTVLQLGEVRHVPDPDTLGADRFTLDLSTVTGLRAGFQGFQVIHVTTPEGDSDGTGPSSAAIGIRVHPEIDTATATTTGSDASGSTGTISVTLTVTVGVDQRVSLALSEFTANPAVSGNGYTFAAAVRVVDTPTVSFAFTGVAPGSYLYRVMVDGAESPLTTAAPTMAEPYGRYDGPLLTVS